jgi:hypothetical protein
MGNQGADLADCGPRTDTVKQDYYPGFDHFVDCERFVD